MINGMGFLLSRPIESGARCLAEEIAGTVHVRLETGAGVIRTLARLIAHPYFDESVPSVLPQ